MFFRNFQTHRKQAFKLLAVPVLLSFIGCSNLQVTPGDVEEERPISVLTGKPSGTNLSSVLNKQDVRGDSLPVNALLWRAALDIASFVPLDDVDTFGGSIVTEWHQPKETPNQTSEINHVCRWPRIAFRCNHRSRLYPKPAWH